jgi:phage terminase large subunit
MTNRVIKFEDFVGFTERQNEALVAARTAKYTLYGGAAGGGKSYWLRWWLVMFLVTVYRKFGVKGAEVGLFCEDYPALHSRQIGKIQSEFPDWLGYWHGTAKEFRLHERWGSGKIRCLNLDNPGKYRSAEFAAIGIDELTLNDRAVFDSLIWRLRWPGLESCRFVAGTNPTGVGHGWVRKLWVDRNFKDEPAALKPEYFTYVRARATDNPHLHPSYFTDTLGSLPEFMRKALMEGSWDVIEGQYFTEWDPEIHIIKPWEVGPDTDQWGIPLSYPRIGGIDWGRAKPWSASEGCIDPDGCVVIYRGVSCAGWEHEQQAKWLLQGAPGVTWYADDACWARGNANSKILRAQDESHYELWQKYANGRLTIMRAQKGDRVAGWQHMASFLKPQPRLLTPEGKRKPEHERTQHDYYPRRAGIAFFDVPSLKGDHGPITTIPKLIHDPDRPEDVDTNCDDHAGDGVRYLLKNRPAPRIADEAPKRPFQDYVPEGIRREQQEVEMERIQQDDEEILLDGDTVIGDM